MKRIIKHDVHLTAWRSGLKFPSINHERSWIFCHHLRPAKWSGHLRREDNMEGCFGHHNTMKKWMRWILKRQPSWLDELYYLTNLQISPQIMKNINQKKQFFTTVPSSLPDSSPHLRAKGTVFNISSYLPGRTSGTGMVLTFRLGRGVVGEVVSGRRATTTKVPSQIPWQQKVNELLVVDFFSSKF